MTCALCSRELKPGVWIYSRFTGNHYCTDIDACKRRRKRGKAPA